jgi:hypothetical protein
MLSGIVVAAGGGPLPWGHPVHAFAAPHLTISAKDASPQMGQGVTVTVEVVAGGTPLSSFRDTISFSSSDPSLARWLPRHPYTFTAADAGIHTFSKWFSFQTPGEQTLSVTDVTIPTFGGATANFDIVAPPTATPPPAIPTATPTPW